LGPQSDPRFYDSLESIHGQIHGLVGKNGHMGVVDFAAFDPVFWLHHCNVDRLFAIWQALNPTRFVIPRVNESGTFATAAGTVENADSPLPPFWQAPGKLWTSSGARDTRTFKYTYPELEMWADKPQDVRRANLRTQINKLYGATAPVAAIRPNIFAPKPAAPAAPPAGGDKAQQPLAQKPAAPAAPAHKPVGKDEVEFTEDTSHDHKEDHSKSSYYEWIANIRVEKYAVKTTFFIHIFLGDFTDDYMKWGEDPNLIGSHVVFGTNLDHTGCERCLQSNHKQKLVTGTIPLTGALGDKLGAGKIANLNPDLVVPYLKDNLHWRIQKHDDTPIERSEIPTLKIAVGHAHVEPPTSVAEFPKWGEITLQHGVTAGRAGGASEEDD
jgi:tyrosinase